MVLDDNDRNRHNCRRQKKLPAGRKTRFIRLHFDGVAVKVLLRYFRRNHKLFDEARERYNAKQKRKDRMIDNYYEKIRRGKQEKLFHEVIFQIGNKDDMNAKSEDGLLAKGF